MTKKKVIVLGAGAIGVSVASYLLRDGHEVVLIDREEPASGCSSGNAGLIQCSAVLPIATPGTLRAVPRMLLDADQPLVVRWRHLVSLAPYLLRFVRESSAHRADANSRALARIVPGAYDAYLPLIEAAGISDLVRKTGELYVYENPKTYHASKVGWEMRRARGVAVKDLDSGALHDLEPELARTFGHGVYLPNSYQTVNPRTFVSALAAQFVRDGGRFEKAELFGIAPRTDGAIALQMNGGDLVGDAVVLATGAFSRPWARQVGVSVPLDSERGYHMMVRKPGVAIGRAIISGDYRFAISPIDDGLRLSGTAELAKVGAPPDYERAYRLLPLARRILPALADDAGEVWMGHRPSTPDSLPVLGALPGRPNVLFAFGHGHLGLTLGGITGKIVAEIVAGKPCSIDLAPFSVARFA